MSIPQAVQNNINNITLADFQAKFQEAQRSGGYVYINKQGNLAVRGAFANFFGIGGISNSKQKTLETFNATLKKSVENIDIFSHSGETTIKNGYGLSADMMKHTFAYYTNNKLKEINTKLDALTDKDLSDFNGGGNKITLTDNLKKSFLKEIDKLNEEHSVDETIDLIKNTMKIINDKFTKQEIENLDMNGYNEDVNNSIWDKTHYDGKQASLLYLDENELDECMKSGKNPKIEILKLVKQQYMSNKQMDKDLVIQEKGE